MAVWVVHALSTGATAQFSKPQRQPSAARLAQRSVKLLELPSRRVAAVDQLMRLGPDAVPALERALLDPRPEIVRTVAHIIGCLGPVAKATLPRLEKLSMSENRIIATATEWARHRIRPVGITVIAEYSASTVTIVGADGKVTEIPQLKGAFDADRLPNGRYLVVAHGENRVVEVDGKGKRFWSCKLASQPLDADRLPNGNTLIAERAGKKRVFEVSPKGKVVWKFNPPKGQAPQEADRLPNGNTLISCYSPGAIFEVDPSGKQVWQHQAGGLLCDADRLPNGNTLYCVGSQKRVKEIDPTGKVVFELRVPTSPSDADRLPNGHTLVAHTTGVVEYDAKGKVVWQRTAKYAGQVNRY